MFQSTVTRFLPVFFKDLPENFVPPPDYDDEQGPESGYITPDPQGSENDFPMYHQNFAGRY